MGAGVAALVQWLDALAVTLCLSLSSSTNHLTADEANITAAC